MALIFQNPAMTSSITGISSMATQRLLAELAGEYRVRHGIDVIFGSVGGVDAARRVRAGEVFDLVVLASDALHGLAAEGKVRPDTLVDLVDSEVAVAVRAGERRPQIDTEAALREAVLAAPSIGYSTGPSGTALKALFARWGVADTVASRTVQAPPGVPVGALVARGDVALGFQQLSELMHVEGISLLGTMPPGMGMVTRFSAAVGALSPQPQAACRLLAFLRSSDAEAAMARQGMRPASQGPSSGSANNAGSSMVRPGTYTP